MLTSRISRFHARTALVVLVWAWVYCLASGWAAYQHARMAAAPAAQDMCLSIGTAAPDGADEGSAWRCEVACAAASALAMATAAPAAADLLPPSTGRPVGETEAPRPAPRRVEHLPRGPPLLA